MAFDPSVLSQIPAYAPNPVQAQSDAFTLANQAQDTQLGGIKLAEAREDQRDAARERAILAKADLSTFEGQTRAAQDITRISPKRGMDFMAKVQNNQSAANQSVLEKLQIAEAQQDAIVGAIDPIVAKVEQYRAANPNATPAQLDAIVKREIVPALLTLRQSRPDLQQVIDRFQQDPNNLTAAGLRSADEQSKRGAAAIKQRLAEAIEAEKERHNRATEGAAAEREKDKREDKDAGKFTDKEQELLAELAVRNVNLPAGLRSKQQIKATLDGLIAKNPDASAADIADQIKSGKLKLVAESAGARAAGGQVGKVALAANELDTFGDQVRTASKAVPRGAWGIDDSLTINGLIQAKEKQFSDPNLLRLKTKLTALNNAYDQLAARGGTDQDKRAHIHELFDARLSQEAVEVLVSSLKEEAVGAREAAKRAIAETTDTAPSKDPGATLPGIQKAPPAAGGGGGQSPPPSGASAPAAGGATKPHPPTPAAVAKGVKPGERWATGPGGAIAVFRNGAWVTL